jgi:hypothetical protein
METGGIRELTGVRVLWYSDWYDGPVSGLVVVEGNALWFEAVWDAESDDWADPRRLVLHELSADELHDLWKMPRLRSESTVQGDLRVRPGSV